LLNQYCKFKICYLRLLRPPPPPPDDERLPPPLLYEPPDEDDLPLLKDPLDLLLELLDRGVLYERLLDDEEDLLLYDPLEFERELLELPLL